MIYDDYSRKEIEIMAGKHRTFTAELKREAVQLLATRVNPVHHCARTGDFR